MFERVVSYAFLALLIYLSCVLYQKISADEPPPAEDSRSKKHSKTRKSSKRRKRTNQQTSSPAPAAVEVRENSTPKREVEESNSIDAPQALKAAEPKEENRRLKDEVVVGQKVQVREIGKNKPRMATITAVHSDGTVDVKYSTGDKRRNLAPDLVHAIAELSIDDSDADRTKGASLFDQTRVETSKHGLTVGDRVEARWAGQNSLFPGVIAKVNRDGSFDVAYDDGEKERKVSPRLIHFPGCEHPVVDEDSDEDLGFEVSEEGEDGWQLITKTKISKADRREQLEVAANNLRNRRKKQKKRERELERREQFVNSIK